jgi:hypothetical protein
MVVETLGEAWRNGWRLTARCAWGKREAMKSIRECKESRDLDVATLVWTRGTDFPLDRLASRLKCPRCGSREVRVMFHVPNAPTSRAHARR